MKILPLSFDSAEENLAFEEFFFNEFEEDTLRIWINPPSVVVGKHQNAMSEANISFCNQNNIPVIRRISGGGTVYHDFGNINFSFFRNVTKEKMIDYNLNLNIIKVALNTLGFPVTISPRHDLFLADKKISGNAQHVKRGKSLHHGTILYDSNLMALSQGIKRVNGLFIDKGVKSVRSEITNLRESIDLGSTHDFFNKLIQQLGFEKSNFDLNETAYQVKNLAIKYHSEEWNFGYSPSYLFENVYGNYRAKISVARGGIIDSISIDKNKEPWVYAEEVLIGKNHFYKSVVNCLESKFNKKEVDLLKNLLF